MFAITHPAHKILKTKKTTVRLGKSILYSSVECDSALAYGSSEATSLDWKSQCLENPSVPLLRLADKKSRIYRV
jgi:hypothetical protein